MNTSKEILAKKLGRCPAKLDPLVYASLFFAIKSDLKERPVGVLPALALIYSFAHQDCKLLKIKDLTNLRGPIITETIKWAFLIYSEGSLYNSVKTYLKAYDLQIKTKGKWPSPAKLQTNFLQNTYYLEKLEESISRNKKYEN